MLLKINDLNVSIAGSRILRGVTFDVPKNQVLCLMGRNGVGKSTTLKSIMGVRTPTGGSISLEEKDITKWRSEDRVLNGLAYVPQGRDIFPGLTVWENLKISQVATGKYDSAVLDRVFTLFPVLKDFLTRKGGVLSGGQQQQLAIGRALLTQPKLLILDEPTEGIQPNIIDQIGDAIKTLRGSMSILLVEQYLDFAKELGDHYVILDRGAVVSKGTIAELTPEVVKEHLTV
ncbi:MAG TPA: urea ABC transporter ATP-binding subunit UrtE [Candidatus Methylacidiphilales bacterium]|nr:urea ABC transporter ATP-binding subunit UrtE [Candidatus Methylacidiphilales bacterium]